MSVVQVRVQYKNVCYTSNLVGPKAHNTIHVNTKYLEALIVELGGKFEETLIVVHEI